MNLNLRELINGASTRLRYVFRYSTTRVHAPETVAEHSYYVSLYCLMIGRWVEESADADDTVDQGAHIPLTSPYNGQRSGPDRVMVRMDNLLERALLHDLEEAVSGDFPREFKHSSPDLEQMLERASRKAFEQVITPLLQYGDHPITERHFEEFLLSWGTSKDDSVEGRILEFADFLCVLSFMMQEGAGNGNSIVIRHVSNMDKYFAKFEGVKFEFLRPLIRQASVMMREVFNGVY